MCRDDGLEQRICRRTHAVPAAGHDRGGARRNHQCGIHGRFPAHAQCSPVRSDKILSDYILPRTCRRVAPLRNLRCYALSRPPEAGIHNRKRKISVGLQRSHRGCPRGFEADRTRWRPGHPWCVQQIWGRRPARDSAPRNSTACRVVVPLNSQCPEDVLNPKAGNGHRLCRGASHRTCNDKVDRKAGPFGRRGAQGPVSVDTFDESRNQNENARKRPTGHDVFAEEKVATCRLVHDLCRHAQPVGCELGFAGLSKCEPG